MEYEDLLKKALENVKRKESSKRFEIPQAETAIQGNQTILRNFLQISNSLRREPKHLLKFLAKELASPASQEEQRAVFQTKVLQRQIQQRIEDYIKEYVVCKECGKPDTKLLKEDRILIMKCEACGARSAVRTVR